MPPKSKTNVPPFDLKEFIYSKPLTYDKSPLISKESEWGIIWSTIWINLQSYPDLPWNLGDTKIKDTRYIGGNGKSGYYSAIHIGVVFREEELGTVNRGKGVYYCLSILLIPLWFAQTWIYYLLLVKNIIWKSVWFYWPFMSRVLIRNLENLRFTWLFGTRLAGS